MIVQENQHEPKKTRRYMQRMKALESNRTTWLGTFKEISENLVPNRGVWESRKHNKGEKRGSNMYTGRVTRYARNLAALMVAGVTSPARKWFRLGLYDKDLQEWAPAKKWLDQVQTLMLMAYARSNFYVTVYPVYLDLVCFGTGCLWSEENRKEMEGLWFRSFDPGSYCIATNDQGQVDTFYRRFQMEARQIAQRFEESKLSARVKKLLKDNEFQPVEVIQGIQPQEDWRPSLKDAKGKPFESIYFESAEKDFLGKGGFMHLPAHVPRWETSGTDNYGRGPGHEGLADLKMIHQIYKTTIRGVHEHVRPPVVIPSSIVGTIQAFPGGITVADLGSEQVQNLYRDLPDLSAVQWFKEDVQNALKEIFFNDMFIFLLNDPNMTATEVVERHEEKMLLLGPVIERVEAEMLDPLTDRAFDILNMQGLIPPAPEELVGMPLKVQYIGLLSQAQSLIAMQGINTVTGFASNLVGVAPEIMDNIDTDKAVQQVADIHGVPPELMRSPEIIERMRNDRMNQRAQIAGPQNLAAAAGIAQQMANTPVEGGNLLGEALGVGGQ
jgi:hypothetical protein